MGNKNSYSHSFNNNHIGEVDVRTANSLERPQLLILGFQSTTKSENRTADVRQFDNANITNIYFISNKWYVILWKMESWFGPAYYAFENVSKVIAIRTVENNDEYWRVIG